MLDFIECEKESQDYCMTGKIIKDRYLVKERLSFGSFSSVYEIEDLQNESVTKRNLVIKLSDDTEEMALEIRRLNKINERYFEMKKNKDKNLGSAVQND